MTTPSSDTNRPQLLRRLRWLTAFFIFGLVLSGATAIPLETELNWMVSLLGADAHSPVPLAQWLARVQEALHDTNTRYPFIAYGADWLAFGHFMIALAFVWAWREPVRNRWLYDYGLIACALVIPFAMIFGAVPLWLCRRWAAELATRLV